MSKEANECIECRQPSKGLQTDVKTRDRGRSRKQYDAGMILLLFPRPDSLRYCRS